MRISFLFTLIISVLFFVSCRRTVDEFGQLIDLNSCKEQVVNGNTVRICFDSLLEDSRCPVNVVCVWQGAAVVKLRLSSNGQERSFTLATLNMLPYYRTDTTILGYHIRLNQVLPYPGTGNQSPKVQLQVSQ